MGTIQDWPVSQRWIQYKTGQSVKDGYNTRSASQRWILYKTGQSVKDGYHTRQASLSKMVTIHNQPVSQRWVQLIDWPVWLAGLRWTIVKGAGRSKMGQSH